MSNQIDKDIEKVDEQISDSDLMEYLWYQRKEGWEHTGVVLSFDSAQRFTLDFGVALSKPWSIMKYLAGMLALIFPFLSFSHEKGKQYAATIKLNGETNLNDFLPENVKIKGKLAELSLKTEEDKETAKEFFRCIRKIPMEKYQLKENNCRDHVIAVAMRLRDLAKKFGVGVVLALWSKFEHEMRLVKSKDEQRYEEVKGIIDLFNASSVNNSRDQATNKVVEVENDEDQEDQNFTAEESVCRRRFPTTAYKTST